MTDRTDMFLSTRVVVGLMALANLIPAYVFNNPELFDTYPQVVIGIIFFIWMIFDPYETSKEKP